MESLIKYILESLLCSTVIFLLWIIVVRRVNNYSFHRVFLNCGLVIITVFPLFNFKSHNNYNLTSLLGPAILEENKTSVESEGILKEFSLLNGDGLDWLLYIYLVGIGIFFLLFLKDIIRVVILRAGGIKQEHGTISVISSSKVTAPFSLFNTIYLGKDIIDSQLDGIVDHEAAHIHRGHTYDKLLSAAIISLQWFNPLVLLIAKALVSVHEYQADMDVIKKGILIDRYREIILTSQFGLSPVMSNSLNQSLTLKRFIKMENLEQKKVKAGSIIVVLTAVVVTFFLVSFSPDNSSIKTDELQTTNLSDTTAKKVPFVMVEVKPTFMGGDENTFLKWVASQLIYPAEAKRDSVQGRVILQFTVTESGKVKDVKLARGVNKYLDQEAIRVVSMSPDWKPGMEKGKPVNVVYTFPVIFSLR